MCGRRHRQGRAHRSSCRGGRFRFQFRLGLLRRTVGAESRRQTAGAAGRGRGAAASAQRRVGLHAGFRARERLHRHHRTEGYVLGDGRRGDGDAWRWLVPAFVAVCITLLIVVVPAVGGASSAGGHGRQCLANQSIVTVVGRHRVGFGVRPGIPPAQRSLRSTGRPSGGRAQHTRDALRRRQTARRIRGRTRT